MYAMQRLMRWSYRCADTVVALGEEVSQTLKNGRIGRPERIKVIANPVTVSVADGHEDRRSSPQFHFDGPYICAIGRLTEQKGFDVLLDAFARLPDRSLNLAILGEGQLRENLEEQALQLGIADRVHLPGFSNQPRKVLQDAELFVLSSRWEGLPIVLLEALATGTPIVSTDCPGEPRSVLLDGALGHLVPTEDPEAMATAIAEALHAPRGTEASRRLRAEDFAAPVIASQYLTEAFGLSVHAHHPETSHQRAGTP